MPFLSFMQTKVNFKIIYKSTFVISTFIYLISTDCLIKNKEIEKNRRNNQ